MVDLNSVMNPKWACYDKDAKAWRVISIMSSATAFAPDSTNPTQTAPSVSMPIGAASTSLTLERFKSYRAIASAPMYIKFSTGPATATTSDAYIPADREFIINTDLWTVVSGIQATTAGTLNLTQLVTD